MSFPSQQIRGPITFAAPEMTRKEYSLLSQVVFKSQSPVEVTESEIKSISRSQSASAFLITSSFTID